ARRGVTRSSSMISVPGSMAARSHPRTSTTTSRRARCCSARSSRHTAAGRSMSSASWPTPSPLRKERPGSMPTVVLLGSLDTKGAEYEFLRERLVEHGVATLLIDTGVLGAATPNADITPADVAAEGGVDLETLRVKHDRGDALAVMTAGATTILKRLHA